MDFSGGLRGFGSFFYGPCAGFSRSGCQIADKTEQFVAGPDKLFKAGFGKAEVFEEHFFLIVFKFSDFLFNLGADNKYFRTFGSSVFADRSDEVIA